MGFAGAGVRNLPVALPCRAGGMRARFAHLLASALTLQCASQAVPVCLLLAGGAPSAAALRGLVCWCLAWAALLAAGSVAWARHVGADNAGWLDATYGFMLVRQAGLRVAWHQADSRRCAAR
jgi:hypothetical protein